MEYQNIEILTGWGITSKRFDPIYDKDIENNQLLVEKKQ